MSTDTAIQLETPEGTQIDIHPAGLFVRGLAFLVDELIRWVIISAGFMFTAFLGLFGQGLALIILFTTYWLYGVLFEVLNSGMTPGKKMQKLQVVHDDGTPIRLPASLLRNLVLWVDQLPVFYTAGIVSMTLSPRFQRLGDLAAGTLVIYQPSFAEVAGDTNSEASVERPPVALTQNEQGVLVDFLERSHALTPERNNELAALVVDSLGGDAKHAAESVKRIAGNLRGG